MNIPPWIVSISIFINEITGGPKGWSLCARYWQTRLDGNRLGILAVAVTNRIFWFDPDHCRKAWVFHYDPSKDKS